MGASIVVGGQLFSWLVVFYPELSICITNCLGWLCFLFASCCASMLDGLVGFGVFSGWNIAGTCKWRIFSYELSFQPKWFGTSIPSSLSNHTTNKSDLSNKFIRTICLVLWFKITVSVYEIIMSNTLLKKQIVSFMNKLIMLWKNEI